MMNRLELALMGLLLLGSLMTAVLVANPRPPAALAVTDPVALSSKQTEATGATPKADADQGLQLPSFDTFDHMGFGLAPFWSPAAR